MLSDSQQLQAGLDQACEEEGLKLDDLGLSFCALVDAHALIGRTVGGSRSMDLDQALAQRQRLLTAKSQGWSQLRSEWVHIMKSASRPRPHAWGKGLLRPKVELDAVRIADDARSAHIKRVREGQRKAESRSWQFLLTGITKSVAKIDAITDTIRG